MKIETSWVQPPQSIGGLDHLGTQAPCVLIYGQLLPGITNVTDRARYYSFYPWLIWSYDLRYSKDDPVRFVEFFRRADCLFTLISERHARMTDQDNERHGAAMVGRLKLVSALNRLASGQALVLSDFTSQESPTRYFMNPMGGLAQYYAGTLSDLNLMDGTGRPWFKNTKEFGVPLAEKADAFVPGDRFWAVVEADEVSLDDLDALSSFCACRIPESHEECRTLTEIYFDSLNTYDDEGRQRRCSLALIQKLVDSLPDGCDLTEAVFRACAYSGALPGVQPWVVPERLAVTRENWAIYVRNDLLSVACQTILAISLRELQPQNSAELRAFSTVESFTAWFTASQASAFVAGGFDGATFSGFRDRIADRAPPLAAWEQESHEVQLGRNLLEGWNRGDPSEVLMARVLSLLGTLIARDDDPSQNPYGGLAVDKDSLQDYPINLLTLRQRALKWRTMTLPDALSDLVAWCLNTHLRVALRKLRQTGRSTFHLRPSERGLEVVGTEIPPPAPTSPRFSPAVQILRDIGALTRDVTTPNRQTRLTPAGRQLMEAACA
jgi:hypothetical protein